MNQSDPLQFVDPGSLIRPGPIGRLVRLVMGIGCFIEVYQIVQNGWSIIASPLSWFVRFNEQGGISIQLESIVASLAALFILNYVVNIGLGKSWGRRPSYVCIASMLVPAATSWLFVGSPDHLIVGLAIWAWLTYFYGHLGISLLLSAAIATPGCEMRAIPELYGRLTGEASAEHHCPAALITKLDGWERTSRSHA